MAFTKTIVAAKLLPLICATLLTACVTSGQRPGPPLQPTVLEKPVVGLSNIYDDGSKETVIAINGDEVVWRTDRGTLRFAHTVPFLPYHSWQTSSRRGRGWLTGEVDALTSLEIGKSARFELFRDVENNDGSNKKRYHQRWKCEVPQTNRIQWHGRGWDAYQIDCNRYYKAYWRQLRRFDYVPALARIVSIQTHSKGSPSSRLELVRREFDTSVLGATEIRNLVAAVQKSLRPVRAGTSMFWSAQTFPIEITIRSLEVFENTEGRICQKYVGAIRTQGRNFENFRTACLNPNGIWVNF